MSKRSIIAVVALLWLLEWVFGWSQHLGKLGDAISLIWLALFGYFVIESRQFRIPRGLHTWGWMIALLAIAILRAWWIGASADDLGFFKELVTHIPQSERPTGDEVAMLDAMFEVMGIGLIVGIVGAFEAMVVGICSWIADRFRADRVPPRVDLLPRIAVVVLQAPIFLVVMGSGFAAIGGATVLATHGIPGMSSDERAYIIPWIAGYGIAAWAFATFHLGRLYALARGSLANRALIAAIGLAAVGAVIALDHSVRIIVGLVVWLTLQLVALRFAAP